MTATPGSLQKSHTRPGRRAFVQCLRKQQSSV